MNISGQKQIRIKIGRYELVITFINWRKIKKNLKDKRLKGIERIRKENVGKAMLYMLKE